MLDRSGGSELGRSGVSWVASLLDQEIRQWNSRALGQILCLALDVRYEKGRHGGPVVSYAVLVAVGADADGRGRIVGISAALSDPEGHRGRGLSGVGYVVSDDHGGLKAALNACMPTVAWQRCQCHLQLDS